jgi:hypothetical protein
MSQAIDGRGRILASAGFPGEGATIAATLKLNGQASLPVDRALAPVATGISILFVVYIALSGRVLNIWTRCRLKPELQT